MAGNTISQYDGKTADLTLVNSGTWEAGFTDGSGSKFSKPYVEVSEFKALNGNTYTLCALGGSIRAKSALDATSHSILDGLPAKCKDPKWQEVLHIKLPDGKWIWPAAEDDASTSTSPATLSQPVPKGFKNVKASNILLQMSKLGSR